MCARTIRKLIPARVLCLLALLASLLPSAAHAARFIETKVACQVACAAAVDATCGGLRPGRYKRCRLRLWNQCRHFSIARICPPPPTTTTTQPSVVTTTTTTTTQPFLPTTTTTVPVIIPPTSTCGGQLIVVAADQTYLGCITCSNYSSDSIFNQYGTSGSPYSATSINNQYGSYGSPYSSTSACNQYTSTPPYIFDEQDCYYGRMTVNQYVPDSVCGITGDATLCSELQVLCAN